MIRVLLVDDHAMVRHGLKGMLADEADIQVVGEAGGGRQAINLVADLEPDIVLLDIRMPDMNGIEVTRQLRRDFPQVKIVILTTYAEDEYLLESLRAGAHGYLLKSIAYEELVAAIHNVYSGARTLTPTLVGKVMEQFESMGRELSSPAPLPNSLPQLWGRARVEAGEREEFSPQDMTVERRLGAFRRRFDERYGSGAWERLVALYRKGETLEEIAMIFGGVSKEAVRGWLERGGLTTKAPGRARPAGRITLPESDKVAEGLSAREREVLHAVAAGLSNEEISQRLGISVNTVKVHLQRIFAKIGVKSRTQAALIAPGLLGEQLPNPPANPDADTPGDTPLC